MSFSDIRAPRLRLGRAAGRSGGVELLHDERADVERGVEHERQARRRPDDETDAVLGRDRSHDRLEALLELRLPFLAIGFEVRLLVLEPPLGLGALALDVALEADLGVLGEDLRVELGAHVADLLLALRDLFLDLVVLRLE
jgi:hypothetical protein